MGRTKVRIELNAAGVRELLNSSEVASDLERRAAAIRSAVPEGEWEAGSFSTDRANATVRSADRTAREFAAESPGGVIRALDAGRG